MLWQKGDAFKVSCMTNSKSFITAGWRERLVKPSDQLHLPLGSWSHLGDWLKDEAMFLVKGSEAVIALKLVPRSRWTSCT